MTVKFSQFSKILVNLGISSESHHCLQASFWMFGSLRLLVTKFEIQLKLWITERVNNKLQLKHIFTLSICTILRIAADEYASFVA